MASAGARPSPRPPFEASSPPPSSASRMAHSRQMSSLSMATFTTTSQSHHQPSEPLLRSTEGHQEMLSPPPLHPATSSQERGYWERAHLRRVRRWRLFWGILLSVMGSWASYTAVRYFIAYSVYQDRTRRSVALSLGICSLLSLIFVVALALSFVLPYQVSRRRRFLGKFSYPLQFLVSFFLFAPTVVNLVLVIVWRHARSSLSLRGRCHWNLDVVWVGVGGQCGTHAPAFGVWLTAAIVRLALTVVVLVVYHITSRTYCALRWPPSYCPDDVRRMDSVEISQMMHGFTPPRPSPVIHSFTHKGGGFSSIPQRSLSSSRMAVIPEYNTRNREGEDIGSDSAESSTLSEEGSSSKLGSRTTTHRSLRHTSSLRDAHTGEGSSRCAAIPSDAEEGDLRGFADHFRALVDRVSRELEDSRNLESNTEPPMPPLHHVLDTHTPYMTIDEFGREVATEEPIAILGGVIKRMPTIESMGSRELASLRSTTLVSGTPGRIGSPSVATSSSTSSRPPTGATMASFSDAASASLASASQPPSRSNSLNRHRTPSELGELVRDSLRARGQSRSLPPGTHATSASASSARPGSGGSLSGSGSVGGAESLGGAGSQRSRSNSLGPCEVLAPVTEHGELGREDFSLLAPRQLSSSPDQLFAGVGGSSEVGELGRAEQARSWASSSPSATSTYFTVRTSGSASGSGGGGDAGAGAGNHAGPR
ncbi:hypothetical protein BC827DRAFT_891147 [Russula dissimulans]|nr:hypothetical protein BC827DRAFT_891147 [Russula dissimulans]